MFLATTASLLLLCSAAIAFNGIDSPHSLPKEIAFHGFELSNAFQQSQGEQYIVEYIPSAESLDKWSTMFAVRKQEIPSAPLEHAIKLAQSITQQNPKLGANVHFKKETPDKAMVTFIAVGGDIVEYNIWKFMKVKGYNGLISYQFAIRNYGELTKGFRAILNKPQPLIDSMRDYSL